MTHKFSEQSWKELVPVSYKWSKKVELASAAEVPKTSKFIVLPVSKDQKTSSISYTGDHSAYSELVQKAVSLQAWSGEGTLIHTDGDTVYLLQSMLNSKAGQKLVARDWGMKIGKALKPRHISECTIEVDGSFETGMVLEGVFSAFYDLSGFKSKSSVKTEQLSLIHI